MIRITNKEMKALQNGEITVEAFAEQIASIYPAISISEAFVESLLVQPEQIEKILITESQFKTLFRIKGVADVTMQKAERRGRKPKKA